MKLRGTVALMLMTGFAGAALAADKPYTVAAQWAVGGDGGWDYPSIDPQSHYLYLSHSDRVTVVDTATGQRVGEITGTDGVHGIALAPALNRGYISCGKLNAVKVFDLKTREILATVPTGANPDAVLFEPTGARVYVFNGKGRDMTVIDAKTNSVVATVPMGGKPEFAQTDGRGSLFVNIEDTAELVQIDIASVAVKARWKLPHCEEPTGLVLDAVNHRGFSTCGNRNLAVTNLDTGASVASIAIGEGVDGAEFDAATGNVLTANGEGDITVVHVDGADKFRTLQTLKTQRGARTITQDPATHRFYLPTAQLTPATATPENPHPRPVAVPGSFVVLVVQQ